MHSKNFLKFFFLLLLLPFFAKSQVTTGSLTGHVSDSSGKSLDGATITATHTPSGTVYKTIVNKDGVFNIQGMRVGGPYTVKIESVGMETQLFGNINISLGEPYSINAKLSSSSNSLAEIVVSGTTRRVGTNSGGMSSITTSQQLNSLPTISRSITDFTRLSPQANGNNFGGRDARYNNITVDGANLNNNFGLSSDPLPGGGNNPISLDAIEQVSVSLAPYDVRQGNFTGGNIAAITKSGTNTFHGTAYTYWQNQGLQGWKIAGVEASHPEAKSNIYGGSIGGPIIRNKLFFFINGEYETKPPAAGITWTPTGGSNSGNISNVTTTDLQAVSDYLQQKYSYNPGVYDNFPAFKNTNHKILAKIDWNISTKHKLSVKYSDFKGTQDFQPSQSGNIGGVFSGATYGPKFSQTAMSFSSVLYQQLDIVRSGSIELNSNFSNRLSNQFLATFTKIQSDKTHSGQTFPFIDILTNAPTDKNNYISVGNEPFNGNNNKVHNDVLTITDNVSYNAGRHNLTGGVSYEYQKVGNMFMRGSQGYYVYASVSDFINNAAPLKYAQTYSLVPGEDAVYSAQLKIGQLSIYAQDEFKINPKFTLTYGIRVDKPIFPEEPLENPANTALTFHDQHGNDVHYNTGKWPKATALFSPRVSFRYDILGDKSLILRGGTGMFTGRIPYVYLTNIPTNSGMYQYTASVDYTMSGIDMNNYKFNPDPHAYNPFYNKNLPADRFPTTAGSTPSGDFVVADPNYKFPQVWRTDLGIDKKLGNNWKVTVEALYTKDINATYMFDANQADPDASITTGSYTRGFYTSSTARKLNSSIYGSAMVLTSTNKGHSFVFTAQVEKSYTNGLSMFLAYTYTSAKNLTENPGSQASSVYAANVTQNTLNDLELANSGYSLPHRIIGNVSYHFEYLKHLGTTVSFVYEGASQGRYSYVYSGSVNGQGNNNANLMYIPKDATDPNEITFVDHTYYINGQPVLYTAAQQASMFNTYINQDPYLSKHKGEVAKRNGALYPWYNRIDMKFVQDIFANIGTRKPTLQFTADIYNVLNLLNNRWGIRQLYTIKNPLAVASTTANGDASFYINTYNGLPVTQTFVNNISLSTTWAMQLGLRLIF